MVENVQYILALGLPAGGEWVVILIVAFLIFGKRLPNIARDMGRSLLEFKKGVRETEETKDEIVNEVNKVKNSIVDETKAAAGLKDSGKSD